MDVKKWEKDTTPILAKWLKATENLRMHLYNAPIDVETAEILIKLIGQQPTLENLLLLLQVLQGTALPFVLDTPATVVPLLSVLSVMENPSQNSFDQQRILTFISTASFQIMESDLDETDPFNGAGDWQLELPIELD